MWHTCGWFFISYHYCNVFLWIVLYFSSSLRLIPVDGSLFIIIILSYFLWVVPIIQTYSCGFLGASPMKNLGPPPPYCGLIAWPPVAPLQNFLQLSRSFAVTPTILSCDESLKEELNFYSRWGWICSPKSNGESMKRRKYNDFSIYLFRGSNEYVEYV